MAVAMLEVPLILFAVVVAPIWIIAHYTTRWRMAKSLTPEDEKQFAELWQIAERMEERMGNIERILDAEAAPAGEKQG
jgi:phage shock protein B